MTILHAKGRRWCIYGIIICEIVAGIFAALVVGVYRAADNLPVLSARIAEAEQRHKNTSALRALAGETAAFTSALQEVVIPKAGVADFIERLETAGRRIEVVVAIDSVEPRTHAASDLEELRVALHATGQWEKIARFIALLETMPLESRLQSAALSRTGASGELWRAELLLSALKEK